MNVTDGLCNHFAGAFDMFQLQGNTVHFGSGLRHWQMTMMAAPLVPTRGQAALPPPIGEMRMIQVPGTVLGIRNDPIHAQFPTTTVINGLLIIESRFQHWTGSRDGIAIYTTYNGSALSASVTSEGGRNPLAPYNGSVASSAVVDPAARLGLEWHQVGSKVWMNHMVHGWDNFGQDRGLDWRDGTPTSLETMYDRDRVTVRQMLWVPTSIPGLGIAEQTLHRDDLRDTYTVAVWFPRVTTQPWTLQRQYQGDSRGLPPNFIDEGGLESLKGGMGEFGSPRDAALTGDRTRGMTPAPSHKLASGGEIRQHIIANPYGPTYWEAAPAFVLRLFPVDERQALRIQAVAHVDAGGALDHPAF